MARPPSGGSTLADKGVPPDEDTTCLLGRRRRKKNAPWIQYVSSVDNPPDHSVSGASPDSSVSSLSSDRTYSRRSSDSENSCSGKAADEDCPPYQKVDGSPLPSMESRLSICLDDHATSANAKDSQLAMTRAQLNYYTHYFYRMCPDAYGNANSTMVKQFFELSGLTNERLVEIWFIADHNGDGQLDMKEFIVAMHLIALAVKSDSRHGVAMKGERPELPEFTSQLDNKTALIAPKPIRPVMTDVEAGSVAEELTAHVIPSCALPESIADENSADSLIRNRLYCRPSWSMRSNLGRDLNCLPKLDSTINELTHKLSKCRNGSIREQAFINSEIESHLMHWQRYLHKLIEYRMYLEIKLQHAKTHSRPDDFSESNQRKPAL